MGGHFPQGVENQTNENRLEKGMEICKAYVEIGFEGVGLHEMFFLMVFSEYM